MISHEYNETYCRAEITDNEGQKQVIRKGIVLDLEEDGALAEIHLLNLTDKQKKILLRSLLVIAE